MTFHQYSIHFGGEKVGFAHFRILESREEAEYEDHGWYEKYWFDEQLGILGIAEQYPVLLLRYIEIDYDHHKNGHGARFLDFIEDFGAKKGCSLAFCVVHTNYRDDIMARNIRFYLRAGWRIWEEESGKELFRSPEEQDNFSAFKVLELMPLQKTEDYSFLPMDIPQSELDYIHKRTVR